MEGPKGCHGYIWSQQEEVGQTQKGTKDLTAAFEELDPANNLAKREGGFCPRVLSPSILAGAQPSAILDLDLMKLQPCKNPSGLLTFSRRQCMVLFYVWVCVMQQSKIHSVEKASKLRNMVEMLDSTRLCGLKLGVALISSSSSISFILLKEY